MRAGKMIVNVIISGSLIYEFIKDIKRKIILLNEHKYIQTHTYQSDLNLNDEQHHF